MASFFKVLVGDFTRQLPLPRSLLLECGPDVCRNVQLRHSASGKKWNVEMELLEEDSLCFTRGWQEFAADVGLQEGEVVAFMFDRGFTFNVLVYGANTCERKALAAAAAEDEDEDCKPPRFTIQFKQHHRSRVSIPAQFRSETGMKERECVTLECGNMEAVVKLEQRNSLYMTELGKGWNEFQKASGMVIGNTYSFEYNASRDVIRVKEVKKGK